MQIGFFSWPHDLDFIGRIAAAGDRFGYDMVGIADTPGNAMDPWVSLTALAQACRGPRVALCITNLTTRHPAVSAGAIASVDTISGGRAVLGIGSGNTSTRNLGARSATAREMREGVLFIKELLRGRPAALGGAEAHLPWIRRAPPVFLAASHPKSLEAAGRAADGVFVNYGLSAGEVADSEAAVARGAEAAGRDPADVEVWHIAALDCDEDGEAARRKIGAILAFISDYIVGKGDPAKRGVPPEHREAMIALRERSSTRPGEANIRLVKELGLFDYLCRRHAVCGTPEECLEQVRAARAAGAHRLMFSVSLASDPVQTVELFGERVLPALRG